MGRFALELVGGMRRLSPRTWVTAAALSAALLFGSAAPALAFDGGPHSEITRDAMSAEGFGNDAIGLAEVNNWWVDFYEQASTNPFSGQGGFIKRVLAGAFRAEDWSQELREAAFRSHFDNSLALSNTLAITAEWDRLRRTVWNLSQDARNRNDPEELAAVLGMSLHEVQDFYAHSNWVEAQSGHGVPGSDGPGWQERGYGSSPTWFDIPPSVREEANIYSDESQGHRQHGSWESGGNVEVTYSMNKDWPGRPYYMQAAITAYFASRQWIEAVRSWVGDESFWARTQSWIANGSRQSELEFDLEGMHGISSASGHWQGQGEPTFGDRPGPGGSLVDLRIAAQRYFQAHGSFGFGLHKTKFRARFEELLPRMAEQNPVGRLLPVPSSQGLQASMRMVVLKITHLHSEGLGDPLFDPADMYANVRVDGQGMTSAVIANHSAFSFDKPSAPFTWIKAVPDQLVEEEPVESIKVQVTTANDRGAGTDDGVHVRFGPNLRFALNKDLYDDFERDSTDTYSVPIDDAVRRGLRVGDLTRFWIEKDGDGLGGAWKLGGVKLWVNGVQVYSDQKINRWLEDDHRTWEAPDYRASNIWVPKIPIWLNLNDSDSVIPYGGDDIGDINPYDHRRTVGFAYEPGTVVQAKTTGGSLLGGHTGDGDGASINYRVETITPETIQVPPPAPSLPPTPPGSPTPPPDSPKPDLVITEFGVSGITVKNQGEGAAGPFRVRIITSVPQEVKTLPGLAAGASISWSPAGLSCNGNYLAIADDLEQVEETNEKNNTREAAAEIC